MTAPLLRAADDRLREALRVVIDKHDAYRAAQNGDGHPDQSHDRELAHLTAAPGEYVSTVNGCAGCGGAQYGSESDFHDAIDAARALLSAPSPVREPCAPLEKALRELRDAAQSFRGNKPYRESDPTEQPLLDALMAADALLALPSR